ncbi:MAG: hypothetical protein HY658_03090 [Actinobacteria bacterium]|nr:hypothetical protein [Actinomycetota bacterium]
MAVTLLVMSIITAAFLSVFARTLRDSETVQGRRDYLNDMRIAMEQMTKHIRQATNVDTMQADYLGMDTLVNGVAKHIHYQVVDSTLYRQVDGGTQVPVLGDLATSSVFTYTTVDGTLQEVDILFTVDIGTRTLNLGSQVEMRNL